MACFTSRFNSVPTLSTVYSIIYGDVSTYLSTNLTFCAYTQGLNFLPKLLKIQLIGICPKIDPLGVNP